MEEKRESQEPMTDSLDNIVALFEKLVTEWNKLVAMQKENIAWLENVKRGQL